MHRQCLGIGTSSPRSVVPQRPRPGYPRARGVYRVRALPGPAQPAHEMRQTPGLARADRDALNQASAANVGIHAVRRVARDPAVRKAGLVRPLVRVLRLPRPLHPPLALLVRDRLRLPVLAQERLEVCAERRRAARQAAARPDARRARERAVVPRAEAAPVEVPRAVGLRGRPFADDHPEVEGGELGPEGARGGDVLGVRAGDLLRVCPRGAGGGGGQRAAREV